MFSSLSAALRNRIWCRVLIFLATSRPFDKSTSRQLAFLMIFKTIHKITKQMGARYAERKALVFHFFHNAAPLAIIKMKRHPVMAIYAVNGCPWLR